MSNLRIAARTWWRHTSRRPLTYGLGMSVLALGVAALTVVAALYRDVFSRPLPFPAVDELVTVAVPVRLGQSRTEIPDEFANVPSFAAMGFHVSGEANVVRGRQAERMPAAMVDAGFFRVFGVRPIRGRTFTDSDDQREALVVIGERLWASVRPATSGDPERLTIGGRAFSIIGVMPGDFSFPGRTQLWVLPMASEEIGGTFFLPTVIGRLAPHVGVAAASDSLGPAMRSWSAEGAGRVRVEPLEVSAYGTPGRVLPLLLTVVVLALVATCAAVCALWVSVLLQQRAELETRFALGASTEQLYRQLGLQFLVPSLAAIVAGSVVAHTALRVGMPAPGEAPGTAATPAAALGLLSATIGAGIICSTGLAMLVAVRRLLATAGSGMSVRFKNFRRFYAWLGAVQTIVAFVLVSAVTGFVDKVGTVLPVDLGLANTDARAFRLSLPHSSYANSRAVHQLVTDIESGFESTPGVEAVGVAARLPGDDSPILVLGLRMEGPEPVVETEVRARSLSASGGFFEVAGIPMIAGRPFTDAEMLGTSLVAVLSQETVRRFGVAPEDIIGAHLRLGPPRAHQVVTVVGVVADVRYSRTITGDVYEPVAQQQPLPRQLAVVFKAAAGSVGLRQVGAIVNRYDPEMPIFGYMELKDLSLITPNERSVGWLLICLAATSIVQCLVALYGISAQFVAHQMRDVAVALVLGLTPSGAVRRVLVTLVRPTLFGVAIGAGVAVLAATVAQSLIPNLAVPGIGSLASTGSLLLLIALIASVPPARRAATLEVSRILRSQ